MPAGSGRKVAPEWKEVTKSETISNKVICNHCECEISAKVERIRNHLNKCLKRSSPTPTPSTAASTSSGVSNALLTVDSLMQEICSSNNNSDSSSNPKRQKTMSEFTIKTSENKKAELDVTVAKFFYRNNIPFNAAASSEYSKMMEALRPGYAGPNRANLSGKLLDLVSTEADEALKTQLHSQNKSASVTLMIDGWSNIKNDPIIATCIHTGTYSYFLNAIDCEANAKTAEYCAKIANEAIDYCKKDLGVEVFAICSDNENKMVKARELLEKEHKLITYGCSAHYLNLLANEVTNKTIMKHIIALHKFFCNHHKPHGWLKEKNGLMPQLPNETRWNSQAACLNTFIKNYALYLEIQAQYSNEFPEHINRILGNAMIYKEAINLHKQISIIEEALIKIQCERANISDAVEYWIELSNSDELLSYKNEITKRMDQALCPVHYLANLLNPKYKGKHLTPEMIQMAEDWVTQQNTEWLIPVLSFKIEDSKIFPSSMFEKHIIHYFDFSKWWSLVELNSIGSVKEFCSFMVKLANCPPSTSSIERMFSTCGLVWSKLRNSLGLETAKKLVKVHRYLKQNA